MSFVSPPPLHVDIFVGDTVLNANEWCLLYVCQVCDLPLSDLPTLRGKCQRSLTVFPVFIPWSPLWPQIRISSCIHSILFHKSFSRKVIWFLLPFHNWTQLVRGRNGHHIECCDECWLFYLLRSSDETLLLWMRARILIPWVRCDVFHRLSSKGQLLKTGTKLQFGMTALCSNR